MSSAGSGSSNQPMSSGFVEARAADRLVDREGLIGVDENLEGGADRRAHRREPLDVLARPAGRP